MRRGPLKKRGYRGEENEHQYYSQTCSTEATSESKLYLLRSVRIQQLLKNGEPATARRFSPRQECGGAV
jgi:hypothetical protein